LAVGGDADLAARDLDELAPALGGLEDARQRLERLAVVGLRLEDLAVVLDGLVDVAQPLLAEAADAQEDGEAIVGAGGARQAVLQHRDELVPLAGALEVALEGLWASRSAGFRSWMRP